MIRLSSCVVALKLNRILLALVLCFALTLSSVQPASAAMQIDIYGPAGSGIFGSLVASLPNGNFIVLDPQRSVAGKSQVGAVYLYDGKSGTMISELKGSLSNDQIGSGGVVVLANGNFVVISPHWHNQDLYLEWADAGAVTWVNGKTGLNGYILPSNSLVGNRENSLVGYGGVTALPSGNYVVNSFYWDSALALDVGAVSWGNGSTGTAGYVSSSNSLIGSEAGDQVGSGGITVLKNGNYVVQSPSLDSGSADNVGAVTWGNGNTGINDVVHADNSLVGSNNGDSIGLDGVIALSNGNYVVSSTYWDSAARDVGAVTWGNGNTGTIGEVTSANSLVGRWEEDYVGSGGVTALTNGNYVINSPDWDNGIYSTNVGAVTWGNGSVGSSGSVTSANSLVGNTQADDFGDLGVTALKNGNYVVISTSWDSASATDVGAVTWGNGSVGSSGGVTSANSLVGSQTGDNVGIGGVVALSNSNYVVSSPFWDRTSIKDAGAVTWGNGSTGVSGAVATLTSLVGNNEDDVVGYYGAEALTNGNYVVLSPFWDNASEADVGAATWGNGATGIKGDVSSSNSLVGFKAGDMIGNGVTVLTNGNYVVYSPWWDSVSAVDVGAATWGNGTIGTSGTVLAANSLVGIASGGFAGWVSALADGNYIVNNQYWNNGLATQAGAITWGNGATGTIGVMDVSNSLVGSNFQDMVGQGTLRKLQDGGYLITSIHWRNPSITPGINAGAVSWSEGGIPLTGLVNNQNSVLGFASNGGSTMVFDFDPVNYQLIVGRPNENIVTLFRRTRLFLPLVTR